MNNNYEHLTDGMIAKAIDLGIRYLNTRLGRDETDTRLMEDKDSVAILTSYMTDLKHNIHQFQINDDKSIVVKKIDNLKLEVGDKVTVYVYMDEESPNIINFAEYLEVFQQQLQSFFHPHVIHVLASDIPNYEVLCRNCAILYKAITGIKIMKLFYLHFNLDKINDKYDKMLLGVRLTTVWNSIMNNDEIACIKWNFDGDEYMNLNAAVIICKSDNSLYIGDCISSWAKLTDDEFRFDL